MSTRSLKFMEKHDMSKMYFIIILQSKTGFYPSAQVKVKKCHQNKKNQRWKAPNPKIPTLKKSDSIKKTVDRLPSTPWKRIALCFNTVPSHPPTLSIIAFRFNETQSGQPIKLSELKTLQSMYIVVEGFILIYFSQESLQVNSCAARQV